MGRPPKEPPLSQDAIMRQSGWISCADAAEAAGVHISTVYRLIERGEVEGATAGGKRYVCRKSLATYYEDAPPIKLRVLLA